MSTRGEPATRAPLPFALAAALALAAFAAPAARAQTAAAPAPEPPLLRVVADPAAVAQLAAQLDPALATGDASGDDELVVGADGRARLQRAARRVAGATVAIELRPRAWLLRERAAAERATRVLGLRLDALLRFAGLGAGTGRLVADGALAVASDVARLEVVALRPAAGELRIEVRCTPADGSALQRWIRLAAPSRLRALPPLRDPALTLQAAVPAGDARALLVPFAPLLDAATGTAAGAGATGDRGGGDAAAESRERERLLDCLDGSLTFALAADRSVLAVGLRRPREYAELVTAPAAVARQRDELAGRSLDGSVEPAAFRHRGVDVLRTRIAPRQPTGLEDADGVVESFAAGVGDVWLTTAGGERAEEFAKRTLDGALDANLFRPLESDGDAPLLRLDVDLGRLSRLAAFASVASELRAEAPQRIDLSLSRVGESLTVRVHLR